LAGPLDDTFLHSNLATSSVLVLAGTMPYPEPRGGNETALQRRRRTS
jgi:hypothetical protein